MVKTAFYIVDTGSCSIVETAVADWFSRLDLDKIFAIAIVV